MKSRADTNQLSFMIKRLVKTNHDQKTGLFKTLMLFLKKERSENPTTLFLFYANKSLVEFIGNKKKNNFNRKNFNSRLSCRKG